MIKFMTMMENIELGQLMVLMQEKYFIEMENLDVLMYVEYCMKIIHYLQTNLYVNY